VHSRSDFYSASAKYLPGGARHHPTCSADELGLAAARIILGALREDAVREH
jgi:hypothetical protein